MATITTTPLPESTTPEVPGPHRLRGAFRHPPQGRKTIGLTA
jgi:hypothetical protein